jgi:hypothetical protein
MGWEVHGTGIQRYALELAMLNMWLLMLIVFWGYCTTWLLGF